MPCTTLITAMPIDLMVQLDDVGIDWTTINEWELFLLLFNNLKTDPCLSLVFGKTDLSNYEPAVDEAGQVVLFDSKTGDVIDRSVYLRIASTLREIHGLERNHRKPGNAEAKRYMLERARIKQKRAARRKKKSELEALIVAMVNAREFKYNFESVLGLTIYQFNASVAQVIRRVHYDNLMFGAYMGTVNMKEINQDDLNWLAPSKK